MNKVSQMFRKYAVERATGYLFWAAVGALPGVGISLAINDSPERMAAQEASYKTASTELKALLAKPAAKDTLQEFATTFHQLSDKVRADGMNCAGKSTSSFSHKPEHLNISAAGANFSFPVDAQKFSQCLSERASTYSRIAGDIRPAYDERYQRGLMLGAIMGLFGYNTYRLRRRPAPAPAR